MHTTKRMRVVARFSMLLFPIAVAIATPAAWKTKQIAQWSEEDARQVLADSGWVKSATGAVLPELTAAQRHEGGATGGGTGGGLKALEGITLLGTGGGERQPAKRIPSSAPVMLRWESAVPVRAAEMKGHEIGAPDLEGDEYALAVYRVPGLNADQKGLAGELKRMAALKRAGKKDLKPSLVKIVAQAGGSSTVVYLFPRSGEITKADICLEFVAQIGRLVIAQYFYTGEMEFQGKLEL